MLSNNPQQTTVNVANSISAGMNMGNVYTQNVKVDDRISTPYTLEVYQGGFKMTNPGSHTSTIIDGKYYQGRVILVDGAKIIVDGVHIESLHNPVYKEVTIATPVVNPASTGKHTGPKASGFSAANVNTGATTVIGLSGDEVWSDKFNTLTQQDVTATGYKADRKRTQSDQEVNVGKVTSVGFDFGATNSSSASTAGNSSHSFYTTPSTNTNWELHTNSCYFTLFNNKSNNNLKVQINSLPFDITETIDRVVTQYAAGSSQIGRDTTGKVNSLVLNHVDGNRLYRELCDIAWPKTDNTFTKK